jgi:hypothetical protein
VAAVTRDGTDSGPVPLSGGGMGGTAARLYEASPVSEGHGSSLTDDRDCTHGR